MKSKIKLSDHFTYSKLLKFTLPSIYMMIFVSLYSVVDGFFVSNFVGKSAFAAINLIIPFTLILGGVGTMIGMGGSALVAATLGKKKIDLANKYFSMLVKLIVIIGIIFSVFGFIFIKKISYFFGADDELVNDCAVYGKTLMIFNVAFMMQYAFQSFLIVAEKPHLGFAITVLAGITNMIFDALFIAVFKWGLFGAAFATGLSQCIAGFIPLIFFLTRKHKNSLRLIWAKIELYPIVKACSNGMSEMLSSVSGSIAGVLYNRQLMAHSGENAVSAYGVVMYVSYIFIAVFMGFSTGSAPLIGYNFGSKNKIELKNLYKKCLRLILLFGIFMLIIGYATATPLAKIFIGYDKDVLELTIFALRICLTVFLAMGINLFASSFFTALNDGLISGIISFARALFFPVVFIIILPLFFGLDGVWISLPLGEHFALIVSIILLKVLNKKYEYK